MGFVNDNYVHLVAQNSFSVQNMVTTLLNLAISLFYRSLFCLLNVSDTASQTTIQAHLLLQLFHWPAANLKIISTKITQLRSRFNNRGHALNIGLQRTKALMKAALIWYTWPYPRLSALYYTINGSVYLLSLVDLQMIFLNSPLAKLCIKTWKKIVYQKNNQKSGPM